MNLRKFRDEHGMQQKEVAEFLNMPKQTYSNYENDICKPSIDTLMKLAMLYNTSVDDLIGFKSPLVTDAQNEVIIMVKRLTDNQCEIVKSVIAGINSGNIKEQQSKNKN